jgi:hypothetical protein
MNATHQSSVCSILSLSGILLIAPVPIDVYQLTSEPLESGEIMSLMSGPLVLVPGHVYCALVLRQYRLHGHRLRGHRLCDRVAIPPDTRSRDQDIYNAWYIVGAMVASMHLVLDNLTNAKVVDR